MASKRKKKKSELKRLVLFVLTPFVVWLSAFIIWLYWNPILHLLSHGNDQSTTRPKTTRNRDKAERSNASGEKRGPERIFDEERKKLDDILRRQRDQSY